MTPLLRATLGFCAGLLLGLRAPLSGVLLAAAASCVVAVLLRVRGAFLAALVAAGVVSGSLRAGAVRTDCREHLRDGARIRATIYTESLPTEGLTVVAHAARLATGSSSCRDVSVRVRVRPQQHAVLDAAARTASMLEVRGRWMAHEPRNGWPRPPQFSGMLLVDSVADAGLRHRSLFTRIRITQQAQLRTLLPDRWPLAEAMLLAQKGALPPETRSRWVAAGLVHLLAISGMHVGLIAAGVVTLGAWCGLSRRRARRLALIITAAYVAFLGAPAAALRALLQAGLLLAALELQRPADRFTLLAAAALGILLLDPLALLDPGFQLSFAGIIGLIAWRSSLDRMLPDRWPAFLRDGLAAGVAASALTTPVAALHFGTASWIGIPATIVAVPLLSGSIALTVTALALAPLLPAAAAFVAFPAEGMLRLLDGTAGAAAAIPGGHGHLAAPVVLYLLLAAAAFVVLRARLRTSAHSRGAAAGRVVFRRAAVAAACALATASWAPLLVRAHGGAALEIHVIDVGQGDAIVLRTPRSRWLLVDTGPRSGRFDAGRDRIVPYLLKHGVRRLDALVLTHPDADHIGGAEAVMDVFDVALVVDPGFPAGKDIFIDLLAAARRSDRRWVAAQEGQTFVIDGVRVRILFPIPAHAGAADANDNSVVFSVEFGEFSALFTGDAPVAVEEMILARNAGLRARVLKVGHHGSRTSTGEALLRATRPELALIPVGRNNRYGHPNPGVLARLQAHDVRVLRTDTYGSFVVRARPDGRTDVLARRNRN